MPRNDSRFFKSVLVTAVSEAGALLHAILAGQVDGETEALLHLDAALGL
jgi:hypothetical protein